MAPVPSAGNRTRVVAVPLEQGAVVADPQEVQPDVEVLGEQVGQPLRGGLVRDPERVAQVLDRQLLAPLGGAEVRDGGRRGIEAGGGEVGDLDALAQEVVVARGVEWLEDAVRDGLQGERAQAVAAGDRRGWQVDAAVRQVGDGAGRVGQVVDVDQGEAEVARPCGATARCVRAPVV